MAACVDLLAERLQRPGREYGLDGKAEVFADLKRQLEAGAVLAALEKADGLVIDANGVGQRLTAGSALGAQHSDAVVETTFAGRRWLVFVC